MRTKPPSSLDYEGHLHELALRNWRRALNERDIRRAEIAARTLADSSDKFWKFVGNLNLGVAYLAGGKTQHALDGFVGAARAYPDAHELTSVARGQIAHVHLETGSPDRALSALAGKETSPKLRYWRALAHARLSEKDAARALAEQIDDPLLRAHVLAELSEDEAELATQIGHTLGTELASPRPVIPVLGWRAAELTGEEALIELTRITEAREAIVHWPLPYVRALHRLGTNAAALGHVTMARESFSQFVELWKDGDAEREAVSAAAQFVKS